MIPTLVVDPDAQRQALVTQAMSRAFSLTFADGVQTALQAFSQAKPKPLIILVCAQLPDGYGSDLCRKLRSDVAGQAAKILLLGEDLDEELLGRDTAQRMGADDLAQLPLTPQRLIVKVKTLVDELIQQQREKKQAGQQPEVVSAPPETPVVEKAEVKPDPPKKSAPVYDAAVVQQQLGTLEEDDLGIVGEQGIAFILDRTHDLENLTYYDLLDIDPEAKLGAIKKSYFALARLYHPDRFVLAKNGTLKERAASLFKRMSEGYQVLCDPEKRSAYDEQLRSGEGMRLLQKQRTQDGPKLEESAIKNPQAKKFFKLGVNALNQGDLKSAKMNLTLALSMQPGEAVIQARLEQVQQRLDQV